MRYLVERAGDLPFVKSLEPVGTMLLGPASHAEALRWPTAHLANNDRPAIRPLRPPLVHSRRLPLRPFLPRRAHDRTPHLCLSRPRLASRRPHPHLCRPPLPPPRDPPRRALSLLRLLFLPTRHGERTRPRPALLPPRPARLARGGISARRGPARSAVQPRPRVRRTRVRRPPRRCRADACGRPGWRKERWRGGGLEAREGGQRRSGGRAGKGRGVRGARECRL